MKLVVDSNIFVSSLDPNDVFQKERASLLGAKTGLREGDAIILQVAEIYGIPILTKDKEIKQRAPKGIIVLEPSEVYLEQ